jgi:alkanesulfonate monooxygenase SsuD/methylene tetrahydromethanopterin reductase-like flavin-dependent oxidoreductase (luciferase family)
MEHEIWPRGGIGQFPKPLQKPHPPIAMAMVGPGGPTAAFIAERDYIPISANFVPVENIEGQLQSYAEARARLDRPMNLDHWRVCRNILITRSDAHAEELTAAADGTLAHYFRYLRGVRRIAELRDRPDESAQSLNAFLEVDQLMKDCVIAGSVKTVTDSLIALVDRLGPFGTLVAVGHDWDDAQLSRDSMRYLAHEVMPVVSQHATTLRH